MLAVLQACTSTVNQPWDMVSQTVSKDVGPLGVLNVKWPGSEMLEVNLDSNGVMHLPKRHDVCCMRGD